MLLERDFSDILKQLQFKKTKIKAILDTDTYNEIDDQFALVQMLFSKEKIEVQSINAAPFSMNNRSDNPKKGMELSYDEIYRFCLLYTSPSPRDLSTSRMPSSA